MKYYYQKGDVVRVVGKNALPQFRNLVGEIYEGTWSIDAPVFLSPLSMISGVYSIPITALELVSRKNNLLSNISKKSMKITNLVKKILDKNTRTLVEAGFINGDLSLTTEGIDELIGIMFLEKKDELVEIAKDKLNEKKQYERNYN